MDILFVVLAVSSSVDNDNDKITLSASVGKTVTLPCQQQKPDAGVRKTTWNSEGEFFKWLKELGSLC